MPRIIVSPLLMLNNLAANATTNGNGIQFKQFDASTYIKATWKVSGTFNGATIACTIQGGTDNATFGTTLATFTSLTAAGNQSLLFKPTLITTQNLFEDTLRAPGNEVTNRMFMRAQVIVSAVGGSTSLDVVAMLDLMVSKEPILIGMADTASDDTTTIEVLNAIASPTLA